MSEKKTQAVMVLLAAAAAAMLTAAVFSRRPPEAGAPAGPEAVPAPLQLPLPREQGAAVEVPDLSPRIEALEAEVARLKAKRAGSGKKRDPRPESDRTHAKLIDVTLMAKDRAESLREIRENWPERRDAALVSTVAALLDDCAESMLREDILRSMKGVALVEMRGTLLKWLGDPEDPRVRRQAAENLAAMREDPVARAALERAVAEDPDERVRLQAGKSLAGR